MLVFLIFLVNYVPLTRDFLYHDDYQFYLLSGENCFNRSVAIRMISLGRPITNAYLCGIFEILPNLDFTNEMRIISFIWLIITFLSFRRFLLNQNFKNFTSTTVSYLIIISPGFLISISWLTLSYAAFATILVTLAALYAQNSSINLRNFVLVYFILTVSVFTNIPSNLFFLVFIAILLNSKVNSFSSREKTRVFILFILPLIFSFISFILAKKYLLPDYKNIIETERTPITSIQELEENILNIFHNYEQILSIWFALNDRYQIIAAQIVIVIIIVGLLFSLYSLKNLKTIMIYSVCMIFSLSILLISNYGNFTTRVLIGTHALLILMLFEIISRSYCIKNRVMKIIFTSALILIISLQSHILQTNSTLSRVKEFNSFRNIDSNDLKFLDGLRLKFLPLPQHYRYDEFGPITSNYDFDYDRMLTVIESNLTK